MAECFASGSVAVTSGSGRASGGQPAPVSALRLPGFGGAVHPGEQGDTIRQLISHEPERRAERRRAEKRRASWTTPSPTQRGGWGVTAAEGGRGYLSFEEQRREGLNFSKIKPTPNTKLSSHLDIFFAFVITLKYCG